MLKKQLNRRALMQQMVAIGSAALAAGTAANTLLANAAEPTREEPATRSLRCIDVHHHVLPPEYVKTISGSVIGAPAGRPDAPPWSVESSLEMMDRLGIQTAITSISAPGFPLSDLKAVQRLARSCNEFSRQMTVDHPRRFGMFATLPLPDVEASLAEIRHACETLSADGIVLYTNYRDVYLGDAHFIPVMEELNRRKALVFVHPTVCNCCLGVQPNVATAMLEFPHDTTRTIVSLLINGTLKRFPNIRFIFSHAGGTVPFLVDRIDIWPMPLLGPEGPLPYLKRLYFDLALSANPQAMGPLLNMVDVSHVLVGTDFPFAPPASVAAAVQGVAASSLSAHSIRQIQRENALALVPRLAES